MKKDCNSKLKRFLLLFPCLFMLSGCRDYFKMEHITGEYQYEDSIYLKCSGTYHFEDGQIPVGWLKLNDVVYNCTITAQRQGYYTFEDSDKVMGLEHNLIMNAYLKLSSLDIEMKVIKDYTGTYEKDAAFLLKRLNTEVYPIVGLLCRW